MIGSQIIDFMTNGTLLGISSGPWQSGMHSSSELPGTAPIACSHGSSIELFEKPFTDLLVRMSVDPLPEFRKTLHDTRILLVHPESPRREQGFGILIQPNLPQPRGLSPIQAG